MTPFFMATVERILFGQKIKWSQVLGISFLIVTGVLVSLSDMIVPPETSGIIIMDNSTESISTEPKKTLEAWKAVLFSIIPPCFFTMSSVMQKQVSKKVRLYPYDLAIY